MKIIFINHFFYPDHSATSLLLSELAFALAAAGHDITVVCTQGNYSDPHTAYPKQEVVQGVRVHRVTRPSADRASLFKRAASAAAFYLAATRCVYQLADHQTSVVAKTDPPLIGLPISGAVRLRHATQINWLQDLFPETAIALGIRPFTGMLGRILASLRNHSLRTAWANVVITERLRETLINQGVEASRIKVIPNWTNGRLIHPVPKQDNVLRNEWGLCDKFVIGYSGNLGRAHEFETLLGAAKLLRDQPSLHFLFVGGGVQVDALRDVVRRDNLDNVTFKPYQPLNQRHLSLAVADVHVVSLRPRVGNAVAPSKFYGIAAAGRGCIYIGDPTDEIPQYLARTQTGVTVSTGDATALANQIVKLRDSGEYRRMGDEARRRFEHEFDFPLALSRWRAVLEAASAS